MPDPIPLPELAARLDAAPSRSALIEEAQRIQHLPEYWQREQAERVFKRRLVEFKKR